MKKNIRLSNYISLLNSNDFISAEEFSRIFNISIRTVFRDIKSMEELGIRIQYESNKGYFTRNRILEINDEEINALIEVGDLLESKYNNSIAISYNKVLNKIMPFIKAMQ